MENTKNAGEQNSTESVGVKETQPKRKKAEYVEAWVQHLNPLYTLCWTPNTTLSRTIKEKLDELKVLIEQVADDKELK